MAETGSIILAIDSGDHIFPLEKIDTIDEELKKMDVIF